MLYLPLTSTTKNAVSKVLLPTVSSADSIPRASAGSPENPLKLSCTKLPRNGKHHIDLHCLCVAQGLFLTFCSWLTTPITSFFNGVGTAVLAAFLLSQMLLSPGLLWLSPGACLIKPCIPLIFPLFLSNFPLSHLLQAASLHLGEPLGVPSQRQPSPYLANTLIKLHMNHHDFAITAPRVCCLTPEFSGFQCHLLIPVSPGFSHFLCHNHTYGTVAFHCFLSGMVRKICVPRSNNLTPLSIHNLCALCLRPVRGDVRLATSSLCDSPHYSATTYM
jgi:hypothetical protein